MGWVVNATPRPLYPWERPGTHLIGGWVGPRVRKISSPQGFDPRTVQPVVSRYFKCKFNFLRSKCFRLLNQTRGSAAIIVNVSS